MHQFFRRLPNPVEIIAGTIYGRRGFIDGRSLLFPHSPHERRRRRGDRLTIISIQTSYMYYHMSLVLAILGQSSGLYLRKDGLTTPR
jgi:hypothetical protein